MTDKFEKFESILDAEFKGIGRSLPDEVITAIRNSKTARRRAIDFGNSLCGNSTHLREQRLGFPEIKALVTSILQIDEIIVETLDLSYNSVDDEAMQCLAKLFKSTDTYFCPIRALNLRYNNISGAGLNDFVDTLLNCHSKAHLNLTFLDISGNSITDTGGMKLAQLLENSDVLRQLDLSNTEISSDSIIAISKVLSSANMTLQSLCLDNPRLFSRTEDEAYHIARMLRTNTGLQSLTLRKFGLKNYGASTLAEYLADNHTLQQLNVSRNQISGQGAEALAGLIVRGNPLMSIDIGNNRIGDEGAFAFAIAIQRSAYLQSVDVRSNSISGVGLVRLAEACSTCRHLSKVFVWGNDFNQEAIAAWDSALQKSLQPQGTQCDIEFYQSNQELMVARAAIDE